MRLRQVCPTLLFLISITSITSQPQQQLDKDTVEAILRNVSPGCRAELESALEAQAHVSQDCMIEIESVMISLKGEGVGMAEGDQSGDFGYGEEEEPKPKKEPKRHEYTIFWVLGFVIVFISAISGFVLYINKVKGEYLPDKRPKKLSKKKLEKEKMKMQGRVA